MFSRVSISTRDSDLYFGVIRLTAMKAITAAPSVNATIGIFRRQSARPSAPRSSSSTAACMTPSRVANCALAPITDLALTRTTRDSRSSISSIMVDGALRPANVTGDGNAVIFC
jgi:hypothetical protein